MIMPTEPKRWRWPHFSREEMQCRCGCGACAVKPKLMDALEQLRLKVERPLPVTSGYRCPAHNQKVSATGLAGPHTTGLAADIRADGRLAFLLMCHAPWSGFRGIGVGAGFVHLDMMTKAPRPNVWAY
jgi:uncharacterized protein YcbK (DUF882 family)